MWKQMLVATIFALFYTIGNVISDKNATTKEVPVDSLNFDSIIAECNETFRIEMRYLMDLNNSGSFPDETDKTPKCFLRCVLEKAGVASPEGVYDAKRTAEVFDSMRDDDGIESAAQQCNDRKEECKCERAYQFMKCLLEADIKKKPESSE